MIRIALAVTVLAGAIAAGCYLIGAHIPARDRQPDLRALSDEVTSIDLRAEHLAAVIDQAGRAYVRRNRPHEYAANRGKDWSAQ